MSTNHKFRVFLSAVSSEFEKARTQVACDLRSRGLEVKVQDDFRQEVDADTTLRKLHDYIRDCDAVVCIMGERSGTIPPEPAARPFVAMGILPPELVQASYTQWEFFFARHHHKRLSRYLANPDYVPDKPQPTSSDSPELQSQFVAYLLGLGLDYTPFSIVDELCRRVLREDWPPGGMHAPEPLPRKGVGSLDAGNVDYSTSPELARDLRVAAADTSPSRKSALPKVVAVGLPLLAMAILWLVRGQDGLQLSEPGIGATTMPKVEIHYQRADEEGTYHVLSERDAPLRNGDKVQVHVSAAQPVYIYVFWYDSQGKTSLLWPNRLPGAETSSSPNSRCRKNGTSGCPSAVVRAMKCW